MRSANISEIICDKAHRFGDRPALSMHGNPREKYTYAGLDDASGRLASELMALGLRQGDRVALLSESRPRWGVAFFAILRTGAIVVPLDPRQTVGELEFILDDAEPTLLLVSGSHRETGRRVVRRRPRLPLLCIDEYADDQRPGRSAPCIARNDTDVAVLTYTSGTMGSSKGVATTFGNLLFQIAAFRNVMQNDSHVATVSILPLSHLFELTAGFLGVLYGGGHVRFCASLMPQEIADAMREQNVTCMTTVPLFLKLFADAIKRQVAGNSPWRKWAFVSARGLAALLPMSLRRRMFSRIHAAFGGRLEYFVCGGAPLGKATEKFFASIGVPVYQGYGLAETSPVVATNGPLAHRRGSVGKPLPNVEITFSECGEILTRGPQLMQGYYRNPELTGRVIDADGWLHTGDVGYLDHRGFLYISGRMKNTIVLGSGKKVQPEEVEELLFDHPFIREGCVIGSGGENEEVCAVAVPTEAAVDYCAAHSIDPGALIRELVAERARQLAQSKRPARIYLREEPLPKTSTLKVRRADVSQWLTKHGAAT